ncbi:MAG: F0F1 ATP synthase subunit A [Planctomycetes bacterium]|nr:F0F1 ATP synthase subunit A [Planctomycetota bacterium]
MTSLLTLVLGLLLAGAPVIDEHAPAQEHSSADHGAAEHEAVSREGDASLFMELFGHLVPHPLVGIWWGGREGFGFVKPYAHDEEGHPLAGSEHHPVTFHDAHEFQEYYAAEFGGGSGFMLYNITTVMWLACGLLLLLFLPVARRGRALAGRAPKGAFYGLIESLVLFVRDDMVYAVMGKHHGKAFVSLFLTQFFFILMMNVLGLMPLGSIGGTATANLAVTGALALTTFIVINLSGIKEHGFGKHWKNFAPHGVPVAVAVFIAVLEILLMLVKPAALMIRLFANLTAGHLIVLGLFGLTYFFNSYVIGTPVMLMAIAIYCLELFVCFVQAYIFTYLSIVFIGAAVHPEH